ncbi:HAMP domain-containing histidine kinase [Haloterrigena sp. SYSU A121-1]|uniref:histidine kinase n=1 Tax=Haloterrigena gelatinilytica TaxID=2741724 RepID=A0A8J8KBS8_9EURY|nr:HAMP domain-containing sensor histidine kinase [Haloterrigena gelatinilytica]NUB91675.1 HAMP domain-containing histidine kinase [Haloterrigena gelatinilytica]
MTGRSNRRDGAPFERRRDDLPAPLVADGGPTRRLFRRFPDPLLYYEVEGGTAVVRAVNPAFETAFEVGEASIRDAPLRERLLPRPTDRDSGPRWELATAAGNATRPSEGDEPDAGATGAAILEQLDAGERVTVGIRRGADDERRYFRLEAIPSPDEDGDGGGDAGGYVVYTTVTELRRRVDRVTTRADRLERVVNVAAHDLRNPLEVAKIRLEAARDTGEDVHFEKVEGALDRIERLIRDALSVGGTEVEPSGSVAVGDIAETAWETVETADAALVLEADLPTVEADAERLQQVFENVFRNAVEHGGRDATVTVGGLDGGFYVADDGPGVPPAERERVFEPGYSSGDGTTGLGLAIVRQLVEDHGWNVTLTAGDAGGARFEFHGVETDERAP